MSDHERFLATLSYLLVVAFAVNAGLTPADPHAQLVVLVPLGALALLASAWLVYRDGWHRVPVAVPEPAPYFLEVLGAYVAGGLAGVPFSGASADVAGVLVVSPRGVVTLSVFLAALAWLYALGGHDRLAALGGRIRTRANA